MAPASIIMTSSNENISGLLFLCAGNSPVTGEFPAQRPVTRSCDVFFIWVWINGWVNNREDGDLRRHRAHYDVVVMETTPEWGQISHMHIMTSSSGNSFRVTGTGEFPSQKPVTMSFDVFFDLPRNKQLNKPRYAGDLGRHHAHYDVIVMTHTKLQCNSTNTKIIPSVYWSYMPYFCMIILYPVWYYRWLSGILQ